MSFYCAFIFKNLPKLLRLFFYCIIWLIGNCLQLFNCNGRGFKGPLAAPEPQDADL